MRGHGVRNGARAAVLAVLLPAAAPAQETATPNGIADRRAGAYAFTNGVIHRPDGEARPGALLIREGRVVELRDGGGAPPGYFEIDLAGRHVYPGLIDVYSDYGMEELERADDNGAAENLFPDERPLNANDAVHAGFRAGAALVPDREARERYREQGFSSVVTHRRDGIVRGTSALVTLGETGANRAVVAPDAAAHYSLDKGSSVQAMPSSLMGAFALLRQTFLDAEWFTAQEPRPFADPTLEALSAARALPQVMEVGDWQQALAAARVGEELGARFILKTAGDGYRRPELIRETGAALIVPLDFPEAPEVGDPALADEVPLEELMHWEMAPFNPRVLAERGVTFALDGGGEDFWKNLKKAVDHGLPPRAAIDALTRVPAEMLGLDHLVGQLAPGRLANLLIASGPLFEEGTALLENWVAGERFALGADPRWTPGRYLLTAGGRSFELDLSRGEDGGAKAELVGAEGRDAPVRLELGEDLIVLGFDAGDGGAPLRLSGWPMEDGQGWRGAAAADWRLRLVSAAAETFPAPPAPEPAPAMVRPFGAYGRPSPPPRRDLLIRGATVWTNEDAGVVVADVLVRDGRIERVGDGLPADGAEEVDGRGKHLTPGIIDEHSHIALFDINETQTNSAMVRMEDVVDAEDIDIYRNLAGGVTAAQLLHGSANPIGGQSAIVKMRWGEPAGGLLIEGADGFIKFALGENVKRSRNPQSIRYPQTRMGVEQVFADAFSQAREYGREWEEYDGLSAARRRGVPAPRRDLADEALLEVLNGERFVTSHSYVQSEINMLMHVAERFGFRINTFTHILEGYKVADRMARHGAGGSTFSDWWGYKWEVRYAIPYNAALMRQAGVVVALNSDSAELSRRLNQEAAKAVKYGGVSEVEALKMVTLNPAVLLHLDDRMGSIRPGKDADLVLWSDHPLSIYAVAETTWIEGIPYFDREDDRRLRARIAAERTRLIDRILGEGDGDPP